jgi:hypothetical protein
MSSALISAVAAIVLGTASTLAVGLIAHLSALASLIVGLLTGAVAFLVGTLGVTKTALEIHHKRLEIRNTKRELQTLDNRIVIPS